MEVVQNPGESERIAVLVETNNRLKSKLVEMVKALDMSQKSAAARSQLGSTNTAMGGEHEKQLQVYK